MFLSQTRVPSSPNQSANPSTPWEAEPVVEESGVVEDANAENLYLMGRYIKFLHNFLQHGSHTPILRNIFDKLKPIRNNNCSSLLVIFYFFPVQFRTDRFS